MQRKARMSKSKYLAATIAAFLIAGPAMAEDAYPQWEEGIGTIKCSIYTGSPPDIEIAVSAWVRQFMIIQNLKDIKTSRNLSAMSSKEKLRRIHEICSRNINKDKLDILGAALIVYLFLPLAEAQ
jgi:hypothetical protein